MRQFLFFITLLFLYRTALAEDHLRELQTAAVRAGKSPAAHWGYDSAKYTLWKSHSNRLIPVYTFGTKNAGRGVDLRQYQNKQSPYRSAESVRRLYGIVPEKTVSPNAQYLDQTNVCDIQKAALATGKKHIFLVVFDGMDWQTTRAAAIYNTGKVAYKSGRGSGTHFQDYTAGGTAQFGYMVTSPHNDGTRRNTDTQTVTNPGGTRRGGYDPVRGGRNPWTPGRDLRYPIGLPKNVAGSHVYTDSSSSATSMTAGIKTYNGAVNVDPNGARASTITHAAQEKGFGIGVVTCVPVSHATPASAYAHNVDRNDYQDLSRDLLGLSSVSHPDRPLAGMDVVVGAGWGIEKTRDRAQGKNFVAGNRYLTAADLRRIDALHGGKYVVAQRQSGVNGTQFLKTSARQAARKGQRLFGFYGAVGGHLPFQTADGDYRPAPGRTGKAEAYSPADLKENPTLAEMTSAALTVLEQKPKGLWLMVEAGDVDWANHDNNLDTSIGAVNSGAAAVKVITDWVDQHSNWRESLLIVTADHGHYLVLDQPQALIPPAAGE